MEQYRRVRLILVCLLTGTAFVNGWAATQEDEHTPQLLLTPKLLRRLQRDRERQTVRWIDFETRVRTVPDSPERGFELALYYAVSRDEQRGKEAVSWALAHKAETRQVALVLDWVGDLISPDQQRELKQAPLMSVATGPAPSPVLFLRDALFRAIVKGDTSEPALDASNQKLLKALTTSRATDPVALYAGIEYLMAIKNLEHIDLRRSDPQFFSLLPKEFLLSLKPEQVEHPDWMAHVAALALVTLDPNLENSQFLQGWAMEDREMLRGGPGAAYEFLWADPYLPGVAYQNMDPWIYDTLAQLFARVSWDVDSCWIAVAPGRLDQQNCSANQLGSSQQARYGTLTLISMTTPCVDLLPRKNNESIILWKLKPGTELAFEQNDKHLVGRVDRGGMWPVPNEVSGKVCIAKQDRHL
jgi:hypothetical protein